MKPVRDEARALLGRLAVPDARFATSGLEAVSPITGELIAHVRPASGADVDAVIGRSVRAFEAWRSVPAPRRGELVRLMAEELRAAKNDLGRLVTLETGKILSEGLGEVQEMIDICDFAVGLLICGEKKSESEDKDRLFSERCYGRFERRIPVDGVDEDKVSASFRNGLLTVRLPRTAAPLANVKRITINGK
jgi:acyl-CoA reductase-like NAD-dependent aldehyde dehydrogenase